jgi:hypothetical protein
MRGRHFSDFKIRILCVKKQFSDFKNPKSMCVQQISDFKIRILCGGNNFSDFKIPKRFDGKCTSLPNMCGIRPPGPPTKHKHELGEI